MLANEASPSEEPCADPPSFVSPESRRPCPPVTFSPEHLVCTLLGALTDPKRKGAELVLLLFSPVDLCVSVFAQHRLCRLACITEFVAPLLTASRVEHFSFVKDRGWNRDHNLEEETPTAWLLATKIRWKQRRVRRTPERYPNRSTNTSIWKVSHRACPFESAGIS